MSQGLEKRLRQVERAALPGPAEQVIVRLPDNHRDQQGTGERQIGPGCLLVIYEAKGT